MGFLSPRKVFSLDRGDGLVLGTYTAVLAWTVAHHEPWFDESQVWLLARESSLSDLFLRRLHYEGTPALWHLIFWVLARLGMPFLAMNWVGALFAITGIAVFLRYAPFPRLFRSLIPFTFFLQYQYAVVARSYILFPLFVFLLCVLYLEERPRLLWFALVCGFLSNLNAYGLVFSGTLLTLYVWKLYGGAKGAVETHTVPSLKSLAGTAGIFACFAVISLYVLLPSPDVNFAIQNKVDKYKSDSPLAKLTYTEPLPPGVLKLDVPLPFTPQPVPPMNRFQKMIWDRSHQTVGTPFQQKVLNRFLGLISLLTFPISSSNTFALVFLASLMLWFWSRRALHLLLPYFLLLLFGTLVWSWVHHTGMLVTALIAGCWLAYPRPQVRGPHWIDPVFAATSLCVVAIHVGWTVFAVAYDTKHLYDPGRRTHDFLVDHYPGKRLAGYTWESHNIQPFSDRNMFINTPHSFWVWSAGADIDRQRTEGLALRPDVVVVGQEDFRSELLANQWVVLLPSGQPSNTSMLDWWRKHGYHETHRFCGARPFRFGFSNVTCDIIFERNEGA